MPIVQYKREVNKKRGDNKFARWSEKQKYEAVALYKLVGSLTLVSNNLGIPIDTLNKWHSQDWWKNYELEIARADKNKVSAKLINIRDKAIEVVADRLENGEWFYNPKSGNIIRKPIEAKVASKILTDTIDKQVLIERINSTQPVESTTEKILSRLEVLHDQFKKLAQMGLKTPLRDSEIIDVVPEVINEMEAVNGEEGISGRLRSPGEDSSKNPGQDETSTSEPEHRQEEINGTN